MENFRIFHGKLLRRSSTGYFRQLICICSRKKRHCRSFFWEYSNMTTPLVNLLFLIDRGNYSEPENNSDGEFNRFG